MDNKVEMVIPKMLDQLADCRSQIEALTLMKQEAIARVITPEIKAQLDEIECEFGQKAENAAQNMAELEEAIKGAVISAGASFKGQFLQAVWMKGRVSWDTKLLDGYAAAHPEIALFRKEGAPSVSIRVNGK